MITILGDTLRGLCWLVVGLAAVALVAVAALAVVIWWRL